MEWVGSVALGLEAMGAFVTTVGALVATVFFGTALVRKEGLYPAYHRYRANLGRAVLLGLEFLIAGDIIATILVQPTLRSVSALGLIVLIRTFLSFSLQTEIDGQFPWRRKENDTGSAR